MKRSNVLSYIANIVYECGLDPEEADETALLILDRLEYMGMLPPNIGEIHDDCRWEPENDK